MERDLAIKTKLRILVFVWRFSYTKRSVRVGVMGMMQQRDSYLDRQLSIS